MTFSINYCKILSSTFEFDTKEQLCCYIPMSFCTLLGIPVIVFLLLSFLLLWRTDCECTKEQRALASLSNPTPAGATQTPTFILVEGTSGATLITKGRYELGFSDSGLEWISLACVTCDIDWDDTGGDRVWIHIRPLFWWRKLFLGPVCLFSLGWGGTGGWSWSLCSMAPCDLNNFTLLGRGSLKYAERQK